jgi:ADP-ribosylglycohydrolase
MNWSTRERIVGTLKGIATGDAIGKQTETLSREAVRRWYPAGLRGFEGVPATIIPRYIGNRKREWRIGETTDDTENTLAVARAILSDGAVRHTSVGRELLKGTKSVHPGVRSLWEFHQAGDPARISDRHDGCGAAIRVAPVGILYRPDRFDEIVASAREASIPTHGGVLAIAAAAATAAAVSAAIECASADDILAIAIRAARRVESESPHPTGSIADAIRMVADSLLQQRDRDADVLASTWFPDNPLTIVPLAIALGTTMDSAETAVLLATNIGGDSDSVASIAGGILGARWPDTVNDEWHALVQRINGYGLESIADALTLLRQ